MVPTSGMEHTCDSRQIYLSLAEDGKQNLSSSGISQSSSDADSL
jgi:hypothetical protein